MTWVRNPFFKSPSAVIVVGVEEASGSGTSGTNTDEDNNDVDVESGSDGGRELRTQSTHRDDEDEDHINRLQRPTDKMTGYQFFYVFILDGLGAMILSGGINFAIAYAMYTSVDTTSHQIRLFQLPNTLAGDAAVTIILQNIITWLIELVLVNRDLAKGTVAPIGFIPQPTVRLLRWFMFLDRNTESTTPGSFAHWFYFLVSQILRAFIVAVISFVLLWAPSVGILMTLGTKSGSDYVYERTWTPEVFKLILGGVLALLQTPLFALFWLLRAGWALRTNEVLVTPVQPVRLP
ncbi:hypothetical protein B0H66DRAFT_285084 [Apodospora peruviana]|uniref:Uncharacterized protein n=1 Tax=Apodospora peruviana TaxID=516989 RepID=A0AAE0I0A0_9PEZI|nr:hypothetical protein B0H66DRAFT_285084 [Apodospora peruviana]